MTAGLASKIAPGGRPRLNAAWRRVWRDATTVQFGIDPRRAVVITGVDTAAARLLRALDGTLDRTALGRHATELGVDEERLEKLLGLLAEGGVLDDGVPEAATLEAATLEAATLEAATPGAACRCGAGDAADPLADPLADPVRDRARIEPDLAALSLSRGGSQAARATLARRRQAGVRVCGAGRVGALVASLLAAAGVGHIDIRDGAVALPADAAPGGATAADAGLPRAAAARAAVRRAAPHACTCRDTTRRPDLVVLCPDGAYDADDVAEAMRDGVAHVAAGVRETTGIVGPFVVPGRSACLHCLDLHRAERDPAWPMLAAQLATAPRDHTPACDVVLATLVAGHAAHEALVYLAGDRPATFGATIEIGFPEARVRRRSWQAHPACGCQWRLADSAGTDSDGPDSDGADSDTMAI